MEYRCRHVRPEATKFAVVDGDTPEDAAQNFHMATMCGARLSDGTGARFSVIEVDGVEIISRVFYHGIGRVGGVKPKKRAIDADTLDEVAALLGVPVEELTGEWVGEEEEFVPSYKIGAPKWESH